MEDFDFDGFVDGADMLDDGFDRNEMDGFDGFNHDNGWRHFQLVQLAVVLTEGIQFIASP